MCIRDSTKRMSEDLAEYYAEVGVKCRYMHSEIETLEDVYKRQSLHRLDERLFQAECLGKAYKDQ